MMKLALPLAMLLWLLTGCAGIRVEPPQELQEPVPVFLLDHGRHSSLVLPAEGGGMVRYSYGDWEYYALERTGLATGLAALFGPTPAALGRRELPAPRTRETVHRHLRIGIERSFELQVEAADARRLHDELEALFHAGLGSKVYSAGMDVEFVPHPRPYTILRNSNWMVAQWLEALGCRVRGQSVWSNWRIVE